MGVFFIFGKFFCFEPVHSNKTGTAGTTQPHVQINNNDEEMTSGRTLKASRPMLLRRSIPHNLMVSLKSTVRERVEAAVHEESSFRDQ